MIIILLLLSLVALSFFFSSAETSIIGLSKIRLRHMLRKGVKGAQSVQRALTKLDKVIAAILIGNNLVNIAISRLSRIFVQIYGYRGGWPYLPCNDYRPLGHVRITPKILSAKHAEKVAVLTAPAMNG
jgi:Mg2+/Co2+ transporter CorB